MKFADHISTLSELEDYEVEITLSSGESMVIPNISGKQASLRLLQNHLWSEEQTSEPFDITSFCEYHQEWLEEPDGHHTTIAFLDRYNTDWGTIKRIK